MVDLVLRPSCLHSNPQVRWALQLREHNSCGGTESVTLCRVSDATAQEIVRAGATEWLFDDPTVRPDWRVELDRPEPEEMSVDEMKLEIMRLRLLLSELTGFSSVPCAPTSERRPNAEDVSHANPSP